MKRELSERTTGELGWGTERVSMWIIKDWRWWRAPIAVQQVDVPNNDKSDSVLILLIAHVHERWTQLFSLVPSWCTRNVFPRAHETTRHLIAYHNDPFRMNPKRRDLDSLNMAVVTLVYGHHHTGNANNIMRLCLWVAFIYCNVNQEWSDYKMNPASPRLRSFKYLICYWSAVLQSPFLEPHDCINRDEFTLIWPRKFLWRNWNQYFKDQTYFAPRTHPAYSNKAYTAISKSNGDAHMQVNDSDQLESNGKCLTFPLPAPQWLCLAKVSR
jgi:hypothetical protein